MEFLLQYDGKIVYVKGEDNTVANALSRLPDLVTTSKTSSGADMATSPVFHIALIGSLVASVLKMPENCSIMIVASLASRPGTALVPVPEPSRTVVQPDEELLLEIREGYKHDPFIPSLQQASPRMSTIKNHGGFWFIGNHLIIPNIPWLQEALFHTTHNVLGHFRTDKTYAALCDSYYWPNMQKHLKKYYIPSCPECQ